MKLTTHGIFLAIVLFIAIVITSALDRGPERTMAFRIVIFLFLAVSFYFFWARKKSNSTEGPDEFEMRKTDTYSSAQYSYLGLFRKGQLRLVDRHLVFESNGMDDFGPYYTFPVDEIQYFRFEDIRFSGDSLLILFLKSGKEETFRIGSSGYWTTALADVGLREQATI